MNRNSIRKLNRWGNFKLVLFFYIFFGITNSTIHAQSVFYNNSSDTSKIFTYKRTTINTNEDTVIERVNLYIKKIDLLPNKKMLISVLNFFPSKGLNDSNLTFFLVDLKTKKVYMNGYIRESYSVIYNKILKGKYSCFNTIKSMEQNGSKYLINKIQFDESENVLFFPFINFSTHSVIREADVKPTRMPYDNFFTLVKSELNQKVYFCSSRIGNETFVINKKGIISRYEYFPNLGNVFMVKFELESQ